MPSSLREKFILITGASAGFGAATAIAFAKEGCQLILGARRMDKLKAVADEAKHHGATNVYFHELDVAKTVSVNAFANWIQGFTAKVDVLINNAGGAHGLEPIVQGRDEDWEAMMQINVLGVLRMIRAIVPLMKETKGSILNIGSIAGRVAYENGAAYCASKAGELAITRALREELLGTGIRVGTLDPGMAETEFSMVRFKGDAAKAKKVYEGVDALRADDIAETLVWMASRPSHVNIDEMVIKPTDQAAIHKVNRRTV